MTNRLAMESPRSFSAVELPGGLSELLAFSGEGVPGMAFATAACVLIGSAVASVVTPVYFKLGQTKATQLLPTAIVVLLVVPITLLGNLGILEGGAFGPVTDLLVFAEMDEDWSSRHWFTEDSIAKAYGKNAGVPAASYAGDAKEHAERVVALYEPENVDL